MQFPLDGLMLSTRADLFTLVLVSFITANPAQSDTYLTTPAIDKSIFKEDAVKSLQSKSGEWISRCDEIVSLKKRVCNLIAAVRDNKNRDRGVVIIATDRVGKLSVLVKLLAPLAVSEPILIEASFRIKIKTKVTIVTYQRYASAIVCSDTCNFMFAAESQLLFALNKGESAKITASFVRGDINLSRIGPIERDALCQRRRLLASLGCVGEGLKHQALVWPARLARGRSRPDDGAPLGVVH
jgi:invasion protein IalB